MGSSNIFAKAASIDPLAQALHLPGANKYAQQQAQNANSTGAAGPYAGVTPTLAGANAGYAPGGPGANPDYVPFQAQRPGGVFGAAQRFSSAVGSTAPNPAGGQWTLNGGLTPAPSSTMGAGGVYATTPTGSPGAQAGMNPYVAATQRQGQPINQNNLWGSARGY
jgi:hypothetical protein